MRPEWDAREAGGGTDTTAPLSILWEVEHAARRLGLPLATRDALCQDAALSRAFASAARRGALDRLFSFARLADPGFDRRTEDAVRCALREPHKYAAVRARHTPWAPRHSADEEAAQDARCRSLDAPA